MEVWDLSKGMESSGNRVEEKWERHAYKYISLILAIPQCSVPHSDLDMFFLPEAPTELARPQPCRC